MAKQRTLRELWKVFSIGDHLTDAEILRLIDSGEQGDEYLTARGENLAASRTRMDLATLRSYLWARKNL